jgi:hypothetical protein
MFVPFAPQEAIKGLGQLSSALPHGRIVRIRRDACKMHPPCAELHHKQHISSTQCLFTCNLEHAVACLPQRGGPRMYICRGHPYRCTGPILSASDCD